MRRRWEPILLGAERDRALEIVATIASDTLALNTEWPGLMGTTGMAIFLAHAENELGEDLRARETTERGISQFMDGTIHVGLWNGAAGVRWAISQMISDSDTSELLAHLDRAILSMLTSNITKSFDLYAGLGGVLLAYADDVTHGDVVLAYVLDRAECIDLLCLGPGDFGCAHGIAGILCALTCCQVHGRLNDKLFPTILSLANSLAMSNAPSRIGWCHGRLGVAMSLLGAGSVLESSTIVGRAIALALSSGTAAESAWPNDAGLCHGTAGVAHLYNRMYQVTGDGRLADQARIWLHRTMMMRTLGEGVGGYMMLRAGIEPIWRADASLLVGTAGIGLALLAGASATTPWWDRALGID
jgi:lantibiotic modifying enzyme